MERRDRLGYIYSDYAGSMSSRSAGIVRPFVKKPWTGGWSMVDEMVGQGGRKMARHLGTRAQDEQTS